MRFATCPDAPFHGAFLLYLVATVPLFALVYREPVDEAAVLAALDDMESRIQGLERLNAGSESRSCVANDKEGTVSTIMVYANCRGSSSMRVEILSRSQNAHSHVAYACSIHIVSLPKVGYKGSSQSSCHLWS